MKQKIMRVEGYRSGEAPDLMILARHLLPKAREFYQDPENLKKFEAWKAARERGEEQQ